MRLAAVFGGAPALAGLGTAAVFGLALGYLQSGDAGLSDGGLADTRPSSFPTSDFLTTEG
jgi:hypothetical protein